MDLVLNGLNQAQRAAVTSHASVLQVLAPPGSGKTKTLTARAAYLIAHHGFNPRNIIVCTFTNKAAREMGERICSFLGKDVASRLVLGTFHSIARRFLARDGKLIGIDPKFGIADTSDTNSIIARIIKRLKCTVTPAQARARISKLKSQSITSERFSATNKDADQQEIAQVYSEYEEYLNVEKLLDFDDLVLRCAELLRRHPGCVSHIEAVLIDEFQDTNTVQYELMELFAQNRETITIVGDPDQSIYGWRNAEIKNLRKMQQRFLDTHVINLEENYRSSGAILLAAQEVIEQDKARPPKRLMPTHSVGLRPVLRKLPYAVDEAAWLIAEISRTTTLTGGLLTWSDYAILLRSASLSRLIETALGKAGIPYRMVGGHRFFDRVEIKLLLDYLRVISLPTHNDALVRILNVPPRGIGEKTLQLLLEEADEAKVPLWTILTNSVQGMKKTQTSISPKAAQGILTFFNLIMTAQKKLRQPQNGNTSLIDFLNYLIRKIELEKYLRDLSKKGPEEFDARWANVQELVAQASDFSSELDQFEVSDQAEQSQDGLDEDIRVLPDSIEDGLVKFLANVALATDATIRSNDDTPKAQVTLTTIHAAKGLEWPVVFIPSAYDGSIPHSRAEDNDEERRLLYVAMTRAQSMLYISCPTWDSKRVKTTLSPFLSEDPMGSYFDRRGSNVGFEEVKELAAILRRTCPAVAIVAAALRSLEHPRDNQWPLDTERGDNERHEWQLGANIDKASCEAARKRPRIEHGGFETASGRTFDKKAPLPASTVAVTMHSSHTFSTAMATLPSTFTKASTVYAGGTSHTSTKVEINGRKRKLPSEVGTGRERTQGSLKSFFSKVSTPPVIKTDIVHGSSEVGSHAALQDITLQVNAAETKQRGAKAGEMTDVLAPEATRVCQGVDPRASSASTKAAATFHLTTMERVVSSARPQRRTLGMRMGLNSGWVAKK